MKIKDLASIFEKDFPLQYAFDGDNVGLVVGDSEDEIKGILTTCDVDMAVVDEAIEKNCNLIVSHHPIMFSPINRVLESNPEQKFIRKMIQNGISLYTAHTNLDAGNGGICDLMAEMVGMENTSVIDVVCEDERATHGFGRWADLKQSTTLKELMDKVTDAFGASSLRYSGDASAVITKVAVNTGAGSSVLDLCTNLECDCLITGDIKYNGYRDALDSGMCIIDIMHYDSEQIAKKWFKDYFNKKGIALPIYMSEANVNIVKTYTK